MTAFRAAIMAVVAARGGLVQVDGQPMVDIDVLRDVIEDLLAELAVTPAAAGRIAGRVDERLAALLPHGVILN